MLPHAFKNESHLSDEFGFFFLLSERGHADVQRGEKSG